MTQKVHPRAGAFIERAVAGDVSGAMDVLETALDEGLSAARTLLDVVEPAMNEVGEKWACREFNVAHEHGATQTARSAVDAFCRTHLLVSPPNGAPTAVLGGVELEEHAFGLHLLAWILRGRGWQVTDLGGNVPLPDFVALVDERRVDAVGISATMSDRVPRLLDTLVGLRTHPGCRMVILGVGGQVVRGRERQLVDFGADVVTADGREGADRFEALYAARRRARARPTPR